MPLSRPAADLRACAAGYEHHAVRHDPAGGGLQYSSPLLLRSVPFARMSDGAFWYMLLRPLLAPVGPSAIYSAVLPYLTKRPLSAATPADAHTAPDAELSAREIYWHALDGGGGGDPPAHRLASLGATIAMRLAASSLGVTAVTADGQYSRGGMALLLRHSLLALAFDEMRARFPTAPPPTATLELLGRATRRLSACSAGLAAGAATLPAVDLRALQAPRHPPPPRERNSLTIDPPSLSSRRSSRRCDPSSTRRAQRP